MTPSKSVVERAKRKKAAPAAPVVLMLRTCGPDGESYNGFKWPLQVGAEVSCPDWITRAECGNGLHGLINGIGDWSLVSIAPGRKLIVFEAVGEVVKLSNRTKAKCPKAIVRWLGEATDWVNALAYIWAATNTRPEASAAGYSGHASAAGNSGHASAAGYSGHASAAGDYGHASAAGDRGIAVALGRPYYSYSRICAKARASATGAIVLVDWSGKRPRIVTGYPGEDGIKADTWYRVEGGKLVECAE